MTREGLRATSQTGKVWSQYCTVLMWKYDLSNKRTKKPFVLARGMANKPLFQSTGDSLLKIKNDFEGTLVKHIEGLIKGALENVPRSSKSLSSSLGRYSDRNSVKNIDELLSLLMGINQNFSNQISSFEKQHSALIDRHVKTLKNKIAREKTARITYYQIFESKHQELLSHNSPIDKDSEDILNNKPFDNWLTKQCKSIIDTVSVLSLLSDNTKLVEYLESTNISDLITKLIKHETYQRIGRDQLEWDILAPFQYGLSSLLLDKIAPIYITFRTSKQEFFTSKYVDERLLSDLTLEQNNRLHPNEQSFLVGFINELLKTIYKRNKTEYDSLKHKYKDSFEDVSKIVIAVDEVSDFHIFDLYSIISLSDKSKNSITFSGDLMQRIQEVGIQNWNDVSKIISKLKKNKLNVSYRQSPTLLNLASLIYKKSTSKDLAIIPYLEKHDNEPEAIYKVSSDENTKIRWIANRVLEIYDQYRGEMPSVAIFLSSDKLIEEFARCLEDIEDLADVGIRVKACKNGEVLGTGSTIRVFSLKYIKGLEFEAVIFHNLDDLFLEGLSNESVLRNIYVGLSRATFYTAVTLKQPWNKELEFLRNGFSDKKSWQNQIMFNV